MDVTPALHASAPAGCKCADCTMGPEPCPLCYAVWWQRQHPTTTQNNTRYSVPPALKEADFNEFKQRCMNSFQAQRNQAIADWPADQPLPSV